VKGPYVVFLSALDLSNLCQKKTRKSKGDMKILMTGTGVI
jgi:hypothetical protein